jgi:hypothetical protein
LSVNSTHLGRLTRAATGDTASHLILNRMICNRGRFALKQLDVESSKSKMDSSIHSGGALRGLLGSAPR